MKAVAGLLETIAVLLPDWLPAETLLPYILVLMGCFLVDAAVRTMAGRLTQEQIEKSVFEWLPGDSIF